MPGPPAFCLRPRDLRRGAVLTLAFLVAVGTAASTGCWDREDATAALAARAGAAAPEEPRATGTADREAVARAAAEAVAEGKSGKKAAQEVVSRSGDRWGTVYDQREYAAFAEGLDGRWTGVGLWAERGRDGLIEVDKVQPASPAARAGLRAGDRLLNVDGHAVTGLPVTEVIALLRGEAGDPRGAEPEPRRRRPHRDRPPRAAADRAGDGTAARGRDHRHQGGFLHPGFG